MRNLTNTMKKSNNILLIILLFVIISIFNACKPEPEPEPQTTGSVSVTTSSVSNITETSAKCGGTVTASGYSVGNCGLCYSETPNPTINSYITSDMIGTGTFTSTMSGLEPGTKYYVRAYATTSSGTLYGEQKEFTTENLGCINGYKYVDLGLPSGLKWATCNVGASSPEDYGDYYAWGETNTKSTYTEENSITNGIQMSDISGNAQYDVARKKWGSTWRIPTWKECSELEDECTWISTTYDGVKGYKVIGSNGNHIFLPLAGCCMNNLIGSGESTYGHYGTSTPHEYNNNDTYLLNFEVNGAIMSFFCRRWIGLSIRPVSN